MLTRAKRSRPPGVVGEENVVKVEEGSIRECCRHLSLQLDVEYPLCEQGNRGEVSTDDGSILTLARFEDCSLTSFLDFAESYRRVRDSDSDGSSTDG